MTEPVRVIEVLVPAMVDPVAVEVLEVPGVEVIELIDSGPQGATGAPGPAKALTVPVPVEGETFTLFRTSAPVLLREIVGVVSGTGGPSVAVELVYGASRLVIDGIILSATITSTGAGDQITPPEDPIPAGSFVWVEIGVVGGSVEELSISLEV